MEKRSLKAVELESTEILRRFLEQILLNISLSMIGYHWIVAELKWPNRLRTSHLEYQKLSWGVCFALKRVRFGSNLHLCYKIDINSLLIEVWRCSNQINSYILTYMHYFMQKVWSPQITQAWSGNVDLPKRLHHWHTIPTLCGLDISI